MHPGILATCEICGKTLSSPQSLRRHLRSHKPEDKPLSTIEQGNTEKQKEEKTVTPVTNQSKPKSDKKKKKKKSDEISITENTLDHSLSVSLPSIETLRSNVNSDEQMLDGTFDIKTEVGIDNKGGSQVGSLAEDLLCDFASISTNQLFDTTINGGTDLQEEFSISDMFLIKNGALQCDFCDVSFPSDKLLLRHLSSQHFPNTQWQPAQPLSQSGSSIVGSLNVASTSTQSAGSQRDLPGTSF
jgi:ssDNA-binding Zn-finger/Zn-ribbon topoisomerase 1